MRLGVTRLKSSRFRMLVGATALALAILHGETATAAGSSQRGSNIIGGAVASTVCKIAGSRIERDDRNLCRQQGLRGMPSGRRARVQRHDDGQHPHQASAGFRRAARMRIVPWARQPVRSRNGSGNGQGRDG